MKKSNDLHPALYQEKPWNNNDNNVWLLSTLSVERNVDKFLFPAKLDAVQRKHLISLVWKQLQSNKELVKPILFRSEELGPFERKYLAEHFLSLQGFQHLHAGEAFVVDQSGEFLIVLNLDNHIRFKLIDSHGDLENTWNRLVKVETDLGQELNYAFSPQFGFLTSDPARCGTALTLTIFLQPSALVHTGRIDEILERLGNDKLQITGLQGSPEEIIGDVLMVRNSYTLGVTEENILSVARLFTTQLLVEENTARAHLRQKGDDEVKDRISRAFGILNHSYQIETTEALNAIGLLKLGADLGWLSGITSRELNRLFFNCRRAHLLHLLGEEASNEEIDHKRAAYIHQTLSVVKLTI